jgi:hypothetical protein
MGGGMTDTLKAHEMYCACYGGECKCICAGYTGAIDELQGKLEIAVNALEKVKRYKAEQIKKLKPNADPLEISFTFRTIDIALTQIKDSIYG